MRHLSFSFSCAHLALACAQPAPVAPTATSMAPRAEPTVVHELLQVETQLEPTPPEMLATVDAFLRDVVRAPNHDVVLNASERALSVCRMIDRVLQQHHFVYPAPAYNPVSLHDALRSFTLNSREVELLLAMPQNHRHHDAIEQWAPATFHLADDDGLALLYVAAGERLQVPLTMIEMPPGPNGIHSVIVRWTSSDGELTVSWDPVWGRPFYLTHEAEFFRASQLSRDEAIARRAFLVPMSRNEILGYGWLLTGALLTVDDDLEHARAAFARARVLSPRTPQVPNEEALHLAAARDPAQRRPAEALALAQRAFEIWPCASYADTLAIAHAAVGNWDDAIAMEKRALHWLEKDDVLVPGFRARLASFEAHVAYAHPPAPSRARKVTPELPQSNQI